MQRNALRAAVCVLAVGCLPAAFLGPRGTPTAAPGASVLAVPVRLATGPVAPTGVPARPTARRVAPHRRRATSAVTPATGRRHGPAARPDPPITAFPARGRTITLTFDDGPDPRWTPTVLDLLRQYHAHAIFCMVGLHAAANADLVRRMVREGHALCDHTWTHDEHLQHRPPAAIEDEIGRTARLLTRIAGVPPRYYRAPGGNWSANVLAVARGHGLVPLGWSVDPGDWARPGTATIAERVLAGARPGAVVLMHDGYGDRAESVAALRMILAQLATRGYRFTTPM